MRYSPTAYMRQCDPGLRGVRAEQILDPGRPP
jgi:hypothetical protein